MIFSILAYLFAGVTLYLLGGVIARGYRNPLRPPVIKRPFISVPVLASCMLYALFYGMRSSNTGVDTHTYLEMYETYASTGRHLRETLEIGYTWLTEAFCSIGTPFWLFITLFGFVQIFFVYYAVRFNRYLIPLIGAYIILGPYFLNWANGMRQCTVECIFIFAIEFIQRRRLWAYIIAIALCSLMHKSALILLPLYWLLNFRWYPPKAVLRVGIVIACVIIGSIGAWNNILESSGIILQKLGYEYYTDNLIDMINTKREMAFGPSRISLLLVSLWVIVKAPQVIRVFRLPKRFYFYFNLYFIGTCCYNLFTNTLNVFLRPVGYFTVVGVILAPLVLYYYILRKKSIEVLVLAILMYWYSVYSVLKAYISGGHELDPASYSFFFLQ